MIAARGDFIDGRFVVPATPDGEIRRASPADRRELIGVFPYAAAHLEQAVAAARAAAGGWARASMAERIAALTRLRAVAARRADELARLISLEVGKPQWESRREVDALGAIIDMTVGEAVRAIEPTTRRDVPGGYQWRPLGVIAVIAPFNVPAQVLHGRVVPALLAGNTVVVKPSGLSPGVGQMYAELIDAAGLPAGVVNVVHMGPDGAMRLARHPDVDGVQFTGSWTVGRSILEATLDQPRKLVALEMGGKNAAVVLADADLRVAAREVVLGAFASAGQRCTAISRLVVERSVAGPLVERIARLARALRVGHPLAEDVFMGPLVSDAALMRYRHAIARGEAAGAEPVLPLRLLDAGYPGPYVTPSVHRIAARDPASAYQRDELFGPDLAVYEVADLEEALAVADDSDFGLLISLFTPRADLWRELHLRARTGLCLWNRTHFDATLPVPFSGVGRSGNYRPAGLLTVQSCTRSLAYVEPLASSAWPAPAPVLAALEGD